MSGLGRNAHKGRITTVLFRHHLFDDQFLLDPIRVGFGLVDLVHRHDNRHAGRLGVVDGFARLRHHAVVGSNHQNDDVGRLRTSGTHGSKGFVTRCVEEGHHAALGLDVVGTDVLRDATCFANRHTGTTQVVEQRGLAMVDVTHDGHHRGTRQLRRILVFDIIDEGIGIVEFGGKGTVPHFLDDDHRRFLVEHLVDGHHRAHLHQRLDDFGRLDRHLVRQIGDRNGFRHMHIMHHGLGRLLEGVRIGRVIPAPAGTPATVLAVTPAGTAGRTTGLQPLTLAAAFFLPLPFLVGRRFLVTRFLFANSRTSSGFALALVLRRTFGIRFGDNLFCRYFSGACSRRLGFSFLFQPRQIGNPLLFLKEFGFLPGTQLGVATLLLGTQTLLLLADDRSPGDHFLDHRLGRGGRLRLFCRFFASFKYFRGKLRRYRCLGRMFALAFTFVPDLFRCLALLFRRNLDHRHHHWFDHRGHLRFDHRNRLRRRNGNRFLHRDRGRFDKRRGNRLRLRHHFRTNFRNITFDQHPLLAHLNLHRTRLALRILRPNLGGFLARQGDFCLGLCGTMRATQKIKQSGLVLLGQLIAGVVLGHACFLQLLKYRFRRHFQAGSEFGNG